MKGALSRILFCMVNFMIDNRIGAIINFVRRGSKVADIGTDHGYLAIELVKSGRASFVIATDKNSGPLDAAKKNIAAAGLSIETRLGDGLKVLREGEVDTICIAGMGGSLICEILNSPITNRIEQLILQPMNAAEKVCAWLKNNQWLIADVDLAEAGGIIYEIISAVKNPAEVSLQTKKTESPLLGKFNAQKIARLQRVLAEMSKSPAAVATEKFTQIQAEINSLKQK